MNNTEKEVEILFLEKIQERERIKLNNLKSLNIPEELFMQKKVEIENGISIREKKISDLKNGYIQEPEIKKEIKIKPKNKLDCDKIVFKPREEDSYNNSEKKFDKDCKYWYKQYLRACEKLPDYMREKLRDMPNNKGYIWNGCIFFGDRRSEKGKDVVLFEKERGGDLLIHEIDSEECRIYRKSGKDKKKLVSRRKIRKIK